ncbi:MAG: hypothetical protein EBT07_06870, partial [Actinobacteria bacterium]|nr:hypothetical protein [Actinomycetota bacterium]
VVTVTLFVLLNDDTSLSTFTVNGQDVLDGDNVELPPYTQEVEVEVVTVDPDATFEITGASDLQPGLNELTVTVTAADGTVFINRVTLDVALASDTTVKQFSFNGLESVPGDIITLPADAESIDYEIVPNDENVHVEVQGADSLKLGSNLVVVILTAQDGSVSEYNFTVRVGGQSADTALTSLEVSANGVKTQVTDGDVVTVAPRTTAVDVVAKTRDIAATVKVTGRTNLKVGDNLITVLVTAPDSVTTRIVSFTVKVLPLSSNTSLSEFSIDGTPVVDGSKLVLAPFTRSVVVVAKPVDAEATAQLSGNAVVDGDNTITVKVTAADGSVRVYTVSLNVRKLSDDNSLASLLFDGIKPVNGVYTTAPVASNVTVTAVANDVNAVVTVVGNTGLRVGNNTVSVVVVAENGSIAKYSYTVVVPASNNTSLKSLQVNGVEVAANSIVNLPRFTKAVVAKAVAEDAEAKTSITGLSNLNPGQNTLTVNVVAADGVTTNSYKVTLFVTLPSSDTALKTFTINGKTVDAGQTITVPALTKSILVEAVAKDPEATVLVIGKSDLKEGTNLLSVTVTAADQVSTKTYLVTVNVPSLSNDATLKTLKIGDNDLLTGSKTVNVANGVKSVSLQAEANDSSASVAIIGNSGLKTGSNTLTVRVTAAGGATKEYQITVIVAKSSNTALTALAVNGISALSGGTVILPAGTTSAIVKAVTADPAAKVSVDGTTLVDGDNKVVLTVVAEDLTSRVVEIPVYVTTLSNNTNLASIQVNGKVVAPNGKITVENKTSAVSVIAEAEDAEAVVSVAGAKSLRTGLNTVTISVIAANGDKKSYTVYVEVAKSSNTSLSVLTVNGLSAINGESISLPARSVTAVVKAVATDPETKVSVAGTSLSEGGNVIVVTITAPDGSTRKVEIPVYVTPLSNNTNLSVFTVNGSVVSTGDTVVVPNRTTSVNVIATAEDVDANVAVAGATNLRTDKNTLTVTVIAANGTKKVYTVFVQVAKSSDTRLAVLTVNGNAVVNGGTVVLPARTGSAVIKAVTADPEAKVQITGGSSLVSTDNTVSVLVTAADGSTATTTFNLYVTPLSGNNKLMKLLVNGSSYSDDSVVDLALGTKLVSVVATAEDAGAKVEVFGNSDLSGGINTIIVKVTAANGDARNYTAKVRVPVRSSNTGISTAKGTWLINGIDVADESTEIELPAGTAAVSASAKPADTKASLLISGTTGLKAGVNIVTFTVTAEDGTSKDYTRSITVKEFSSNANLSSLTVADQLVIDGDTVNVPFGTNRVSVLPVLESEEARYTIDGNTDLSEGNNFVVVIVTAPSGKSITTTIQVVVASAPSDTTLKSFTINGNDVQDGDTVLVAAGTSRVRVSAIANDSKASVTIEGKSDLKAGSNSLVVTVTALNGAKSTYVVTVNVGK